MARAFTRTVHSDVDEHYHHNKRYPQYSINSDRCLTMRWNEKDINGAKTQSDGPETTDTILILSVEETKRLSAFIRRYEV